MNSGILWLYYAYVQNGTIDQGWSDRDESKLVGGGVVSLLLTLANIILIWAASMFMFRMKEVLPIDKKVFWEVSHSVFYLFLSCLSRTCQ